MNKHFKSLKEAYEKAQNYTIHEQTKKLPRKTLEHYFESGVETIAQLQHVLDSILFAIREKSVTVEEIERYIEENDRYMLVFSRK